ncbi:MAG: tail protein X, partial [Dysosmobacter sp.]|nr:tail protein X [Dysosmobacter sp.]
MSKTYRTIQGDMWDKIAYEQMGSVLYTDQLIKANADHAAVVIFPAGVVLTIPAA